jgi:hypothetical protein
MEADRRRQLKSGAAYDSLFPKPYLRDTRVKRGAVLEDTIKFIPVAVRKTMWQTKAYVDRELKGLSLYDTCKKLWHFLYEHIQYRKDEEGREQIRSPARAWHDRFRGIDCDCYSTFISTVLCNLQIPHTLRIAKYDPLGRFQHIYPIVPLKDGSYITIDCVLNQFNKEQPYVEIKDTKMDLEFLDGIDDEAVIGTEDFITGLDGEIFGMEGLDEGDLGFLKKLVSKAKSAVKSAASTVQKKVLKPVAKTAGKVLKPIAAVAAKGLHYINKINPATVLLRNGLLASLKLNLMNVAGNLKWSYLSPQDAAKRGMNISKYNKLKGIRENLEKIFHTAGGETSNFKKAILTGKGNSKKEVVAGLDGLGYVDFAGLDGMDEDTPLSQLLGPEIFYSENLVGAEDIEGLEGLGYEIVEGLDGTDDGEPLIGLGEPATASIAAASAAIATIAGLIKGVGNLFDSGKKTIQAVVPPKSNPQPQSQPAPQYQTAVTQDYQPAAMQTPEPAASSPSYAPESTPEAPAESPAEQPQPTAEASVQPQLVPTSNAMMTTTSTAVTETNAAPVAQQGFWDKNKTWLKPTLIGAAGLGAIYLGYRMFSGSSSKPKAPQAGLSGVNPPKPKSKKKGKKKKKSPPQRISQYHIQD